MEDVTAWMLAVSLLFLTGGMALSVVEEWDKCGLTDTSYATLGLWVVGLVGMAVCGVLMKNALLAVVALCAAVLFVGWAWMKVIDFIKARVRWSQLQRLAKRKRY